MVQAESVRLMTESDFAWIADARASTVIWTALTTPPSLGTLGTLVSRYRMVGTKACEWRVELTFGAGATPTSAGTGQWQMTLPFTAAQQWAAPLPIGGCSLSGSRYGVWGTAASTTLLALTTCTTNAPLNNLNSTTPFTWAAGAILSYSLSYEIV